MFSGWECCKEDFPNDYDNKRFSTEDHLPTCARITEASLSKLLCLVSQTAGDTAKEARAEVNPPHGYINLFEENPLQSN